MDGTLVNGLLARYPEMAEVGSAARPGIVHRLDLGTSGTLAVARSQDARELARACFHLGNRHVALQIDEGCVRFQPDHVLESMLQELGLSVARETSAFQPEPGAYGNAGHSHGGPSPHD